MLTCEITGTRPLSRRNSAGSTSSANTLRLENGHISGDSGDHPEDPIAIGHTDDEDNDDNPSPTTPKVDKGKGKALPESQESSPVLQKLIMGSITDSDEEDEEERVRRAELEEELRQLQEQGGAEAMLSPTVDRHVYRF